VQACRRCAPPSAPIAGAREGVHIGAGLAERAKPRERNARERRSDARDCGRPAERAGRCGAAVCAALREETGAADALFARVAERARSVGLNLAGALQEDQPRAGRRRALALRQGRRRCASLAQAILARVDFGSGV
jgi:hypothetical protein